MSKEVGRYYTFDLSEAAEFETLEQAQQYFSDNFPSESVTFLQVVATE